MKVPNDNLVAVAYVGGYCGSLISIILSLSPEVQNYFENIDVEFKEGNAHKTNENWFKDLHTFYDNYNISENTFNKHLTTRSIEALNKKELIVFRCHPNIAYSLNFIEKIKVIYIVGDDKIKYQRWYYQKQIKPKADEHYQFSLTHRFKKNGEFKLNDRIRRKILIDTWSHYVVSSDEVRSLIPDTFILNIDKILNFNFLEYQNLCDFLKITSITEDQFIKIISDYNNKQWKRF